MDKARALMILGPTASGKTAAAVALAQMLPSEIISVDSALVYRGMDIGTAKPAKEEMAGIPHHLIDIREIEESYSAAQFAEDAAGLIDEITARGKFPILAGGTMLYAKALREGMDESPATDETVREQVLEEAKVCGWFAMHAKLAEVDPVTAARLAPNDRQRIGRALEVWRVTGKPLSSMLKGAPEIDTTVAVASLFPADRAAMHARIEERFMQMLDRGFLDEVKMLMARPGFSEDLSAMRAVGYRQAIEYLSGRVDCGTFVQKAVAATRQLAKRQVTWLRNMTSVTTIDPYETPFDEVVRQLRALCDR